MIRLIPRNAGILLLMIIIDYVYVVLFGHKIVLLEEGCVHKF